MTSWRRPVITRPGRCLRGFTYDDKGAETVIFRAVDQKRGAFFVARLLTVFATVWSQSCGALLEGRLDLALCVFICV